MTWDSLWVYFENASREIKYALWQQLQLIDHLKGLPAKYQIEVLKSAPDDVLKLVENHIHLETRIKLGLQKKESPSVMKTIRMVIK